jgi:hypothetical protein
MFNIIYLYILHTGLDYPIGYNLGSLKLGAWAGPIIEKHLAEKEGKQQPEIKEIPKLFMVSRVRTLKGRPYWEKDVCEKYGLHNKVNP